MKSRGAINVVLWWEDKYWKWHCLTAQKEQLLQFVRYLDVIKDAGPFIFHSVVKATPRPHDASVMWHTLPCVAWATEGMFTHLWEPARDALVFVVSPALWSTFDCAKYYQNTTIVWCSVHIEPSCSCQKKKFSIIFLCWVINFNKHQKKHLKTFVLNLIFAYLV